MRTRTAVMGVSGAIVVAGAATLAVAWAIGSVGWLLADLPDAHNSILGELTLAGIGIVFVVIGMAGAGLGRAAPPTRRASSGAVVVAGVLAVGSLLVAVAGAGQVAAQSAAAAVAPALEETDLLNLPGGDGRVTLLVAVVLGAAALGISLAGSRTPPPVDQQEHVAASR